MLANAGKFSGNLLAFNDILTGSPKDKLPLEQRPLMWEAFFIVPVVSTIWTGMRLRTHRRCNEPMFNVADRIA